RDSTSSGTYTLVANSTLLLASNPLATPRTHVFNDGASVTGPGLVELGTPTTMKVNGEVTVEKMLQAGGTIRGLGTLRITRTLGANGAWRDAGVTRIMPNATVYIDIGNLSIDTRTLENNGIVRWSFGNIDLSNGARINNNALAIFDIQGNLRIRDMGMAGGLTNNPGATLKKSGGAGDAIIEVPLQQNGRIRVEAGRLKGPNNQVLQNVGMIELPGG